MIRFLVEVDDIDFACAGLGQDHLRSAIVSGLGYEAVLPKYIVVRILTDDEFKPHHPSPESHVHYHYHPPVGSSLAQEGSIAVIRPGDTADWKDADADKDRRVDASIAKQLQSSIERNSRMSTRVAKLHRLLSGMIGESPIAASEIETAINRLINGNRAIEAILKDEEPTWPA